MTTTESKTTAKEAFTAVFSLHMAYAFFGCRWGKQKIRGRRPTSSRLLSSLDRHIDDDDGSEFSCFPYTDDQVVKRGGMNKRLASEVDDLIAVAWLIWRERMIKYTDGQVEHPWSTTYCCTIAQHQFFREERRAKRAAYRVTYTQDHWCSDAQRMLTPKEIRRRVWSDVQAEHPNWSEGKQKAEVDRRLRAKRSYRRIHLKQKEASHAYIGRMIIALLADIDDGKSADKGTLRIIRAILNGYTVEEIAAGQAVMTDWIKHRKDGRTYKITKRVNIGPPMAIQTVYNRLRAIRDDVVRIVGDLLSTRHAVSVYDRSVDEQVSTDRFAEARDNEQLTISGQVFTRVKRNDWTNVHEPCETTPVDNSPARRTEFPFTCTPVTDWRRGDEDNSSRGQWIRPVHTPTCTDVTYKEYGDRTAQEFISELKCFGEYLDRVSANPTNGLASISDHPHRNEEEGELRFTNFGTVKMTEGRYTGQETTTDEE